jgi:hypothetical protein
MRLFLIKQAYHATSEDGFENHAAVVLMAPFPGGCYRPKDILGGEIGLLDS